MFVFKTVACEASACCELLLAIATQDFLAVCRLNFFGHDSVAWWLQWRVDSDRRMLEGNEQVKDAQISDSFLKDFVLRYKIDEAAAVALHSLPLGQQQEVTGQITAATNPSAVLLSRIKRLKQGLPPLNKAAVAAVAAVSPEATAATGCWIIIPVQFRVAKCIWTSAHDRICQSIEGRDIVAGNPKYRGFLDIVPLSNSQNLSFDNIYIPLIPTKTDILSPKRSFKVRSQTHHHFNIAIAQNGPPGTPGITSKMRKMTILG